MPWADLWLLLRGEDAKAQLPIRWLLAPCRAVGKKLMPIFDQGYQHWQGTLSGQAGRWLAITRRGVRTQLKNRGVRWVILAAWGPALLLSSFLVVWGLFEKQSSLLTPYLV